MSSYSSVTASNTSVSSESIINETVRLIFQWAFFTVLCQAIDIFGIVTNIINIMCFVKQGFKDPVNVSFLGLAISDLGCLSTLVWTNIFFTPAFDDTDLPFDAIEFQYLTSGMPHTAFARVTGWITALITFERCLCIVAPMKVKRIITPNRVSFIIFCVFLILLASVAPLYVVNRLGMKFSPARNKTLLGIVYTAGKERMDAIYLAINIFIPFSAFIVLVFCTTLLVVKLHSKTKWRKKSATSAQADTVSNRNQKVSKMVVIISTLFIACYVPVSGLFIGMSLIPDLSIDGKHRGVMIITGGIGIVLEAVNSSVNIFVYYHMSSRYRDTFRQMFCKGRYASTGPDVHTSYAAKRKDLKINLN